MSVAPMSAKEAPPGSGRVADLARSEGLEPPTSQIRRSVRGVQRVRRYPCLQVRIHGWSGQYTQILSLIGSL
jgi:hypothetical protein